MTDVNVLTAHKGWVWDERSLAVLLAAGHPPHRSSSQLGLKSLHALRTGKCCSYRESQVALGGDMTGFLERLPGAVAISAPCLVSNASRYETQAKDLFHDGARVR